MRLKVCKAGKRVGGRLVGWLAGWLVGWFRGECLLCCLLMLLERKKYNVAYVVVNKILYISGFNGRISGGFMVVFLIVQLNGAFSCVCCLLGSCF